MKYRIGKKMRDSVKLERRSGAFFRIRAITTRAVTVSVITMCALCMLIAGLAISLAGCSAAPTKYEKVGTGMGTIISQTIYTTGNGEDLTNQITELVEETEKEISWRIDTSVVSQINAAAGEDYVLPKDLEETFQTIWQLSVDSEGAFDLTIAPVVRLWDIDTWAAMEETAWEAAGPEKILPTRKEISDKLVFTGYEKVVIEVGEEASTLYLPEGYMLDMGAVGKGLACDRILDLLKASEVSGAVISLGGNILTYGEKPEASAWKVGVVDPMNPDTYLGTLTLTGTNCVTTSGDYERYVEIAGKRYHHIIDPSTGYPADSGIRSVTILSGEGEGMIGDALSTACFVLGKEKALKLAEQYSVEILLVLSDGEILMSEGMTQIFSKVK